MPLNSNQSEELCLHLVERLWMSVLEISKWLPESESVRAAKRTEYHSERVELPVAAEVMKRHPSSDKRQRFRSDQLRMRARSPR